MTLTEMHRDELKGEELDVEGALAFSHYVMLNAARLWVEASLDQKQRLQQALFTEGVMFSAGTFGTARTCLLFYYLETDEAGKSNLASPTGFEPVLPA